MLTQAEESALKTGRYTKKKGKERREEKPLGSLISAETGEQVSEAGGGQAHEG